VKHRGQNLGIKVEQVVRKKIYSLRTWIVLKKRKGELKLGKGGGGRKVWHRPQGRLE